MGRRRLFGFGNSNSERPPAELDEVRVYGKARSALVENVDGVKAPSGEGRSGWRRRRGFGSVRGWEGWFVVVAVGYECSVGMMSIVGVFAGKGNGLDEDRLSTGEGSAVDAAAVRTHAVHVVVGAVESMYRDVVDARMDGSSAAGVHFLRLRCDGDEIGVEAEAAGCHLAPASDRSVVRVNDRTIEAEGCKSAAVAM